MESNNSKKKKRDRERNASFGNIQHEKIVDREESKVERTNRLAGS